jgi:hypothetical protein
MYPIILGFVLMTLGYGLFIDLAANSSWAKIILYQVVAGVGVGPLFQAPLIALQSLVPRGDIATATATFQFVRNFATAISVVIGSVVFQNIINSKQGTLIAALGPESASRLKGFSAGAEVGFINNLPSEQRNIAREVFAKSFRNMWIMYMAFSVVGLFLAFLITRQDLSQKHERVSTGLAFEEEKRKEREFKRKSRKSLRMQSDPELAAQLKSQLELAQHPKSTHVGLSPLDTSHKGISAQDPQTPQQSPRGVETSNEQGREEVRARKEGRKEMEKEQRESSRAEKEARRSAKRLSNYQEREARRERGESNVLRKSRSSTPMHSRPSTAG